MLNEPALLKTNLLVAGTWRKSVNGRQTTIHDPATGQPIGSVPLCGLDETASAIETAQSAFEAWRTALPADRALVLRRWYELIVANVDDLAKIITLEQGKPLEEARGEVLYAASFFDVFAEEAKRIHGEILSTIHPARRNLVIRQPIGVVAAITPWNFPSVLVARKIAPAIAAGCSVIVKPAPQTPFSALALAELGLTAGLPAGVLGIVTGDAEAIGRTLLESSTVRKLSFTGSTKVGKQLLARSAETVKSVSLELGGNAPFIVFDDADLPLAVAQALFSKFRNNGQTCSCTNRFLVQRRIKDRFVEAFASEIRRLRVGPGVEDGVNIGPLIDQRALEKVERLVKDARERGALAVTGGDRHRRGGTFYQPTILDRVTPDMAIAQEEIFGPVATIIEFDDEDDAIRLANDTEYGLTAYFFTQDAGRIFRVSERLEAGVIGANTAMVSSATFPFGGVKQSGLGREGSHHGIAEYLETKLTCIGGLQ